MSALSISILGFGFVTFAGWRMWNTAGSFKDAFRALLVGAIGIIGMAGSAIYFW